MEPAPAFGEPWRDLPSDMTGYLLNDQKFRRAVQCVNACVGMADPAAEIAAMREAAAVTQALAEWSERYPRGPIYSASNRQMDAELIELEDRAKAAAAKLQPLVPSTR